MLSQAFRLASVSPSALPGRWSRGRPRTRPLVASGFFGSKENGRANLRKLPSTGTSSAEGEADWLFPATTFCGDCGERGWDRARAARAARMARRFMGQDRGLRKREHAREHVVAVDDVVLDAAAGVDDDQGRERVVGETVNGLRTSASSLVLPEQVRNGSIAEIHGLEAGGRAEEPSRQRGGEEEQVQQVREACAAPACQAGMGFGQGRGGA